MFILIYYDIFNKGSKFVNSSVFYSMTRNSSIGTTLTGKDLLLLLKEKFFHICVGLL